MFGKAPIEPITAPETAAVDGEWTSWSPLSQCSALCGDGTQFKTRCRKWKFLAQIQLETCRTCSDPAPSGGGKECEGEEREETACSLRECGEWNKSKLNGFTLFSI